jgi:hypothetical protein
MSTRTIEVTRLLPAPPERVWPLLEEVTTWTSWGPYERAELESPGSPQPNGVGSVRRFQVAGRTTRERVTISDAPTTFGYELLDGIPVRDYSARVSLRREPLGTLVTWSSQFRPSIPGTGAVIQRRLQGFIDELLTCLDGAL